MQRGQVRGGRDAQLVEQPDAQAVEDAQRLDDVALLGQDLHEQAVAGLAVGLALDESAGQALGLAVVGRPQRERRAAGDLQQRALEVAQVGPALLGPRGEQIREERALDDVERLLGDAQRIGGVVGLERRLGAAGSALGDLDVDPRLGPELEGQLRAADQALLADGAAQARQERAQRGLGRGGRVVGPEQLDQLVARDRAGAVVDQEREDQPALAAGQLLLHPYAAELDAQRAAQRDTRRWFRELRPRRRGVLLRGAGLHDRNPTARGQILLSNLCESKSDLMPARGQTSFRSMRGC